MDRTYQRILGLRAIRQFQDRPLEPDDLERVLEAARWTGSAKNRQNWSVVVVQDPGQKERLAGCCNTAGPLHKAPAGLALVQEPEAYEFDIGRMAQNIMLAADALGMASCPVTMHRESLAAEVLGLPDGRRCRYVVAVGYPADRAKPARYGGRKPIGDIVHRDSYGGRPSAS